MLVALGLWPGGPCLGRHHLGFPPLDTAPSEQPEMDKWITETATASGENVLQEEGCFFIIFSLQLIIVLNGHRDYMCFPVPEAQTGQ